MSTRSINMRLKDKYIKQVVPALKEKLDCQNDLAVPRVVKVVINTGFNPKDKDEKAQKEIMDSLTSIAGQKTVICQAKKSEAGFKIRQGMPIGVKVTLRGRRMYDFLDRLIHIALPRSRDFRGLPQKNVDQAGNLNIGVKEQIIFPEISAENTRSIFGLEIVVVTTAKSRPEGIGLFKLMGFPIKGLVEK